MADRIRLLPDIVANQIAAGEVVNRPASVVKEMMENAIDAGAHSVKVNFRDGGKELLQIVDDGCGMSPTDARMAFDRHATSKIRSVDDIYALRTFGFRGEALASIAAVAQVELRTRQEGAETGTLTEINGGQFVAQTPVMCPVGSQFFVRNLFYNVPARRRFLEKSTASASQIRTEFQRVALCYPQIAFELYANDAPVYALAPASLAGRIVDVVGRHIKQNLLEVDADTSIARLAGYIGRPAAAKRRNAEQYLFVNGRYFKSPYLTSAITKAYEKLIPESAQPSYFLYLTIDPSRIDVNVHPQKTEVKFADEEAVWQIVHAAMRETLAKTGAVPLMDFDRDGSVEIPVLQRGAVYREPRAMSNSDYNPFREEYIDPTAPDPNEDFTGFDVPYDGGGTLSDASAAGFGAGRRAGGAAAPSGGVSAGGASAGGPAGLQGGAFGGGFSLPGGLASAGSGYAAAHNEFALPGDDEFEEIVSGSDFAADGTEIAQGGVPGPGSQPAGEFPSIDGAGGFPGARPNTDPNTDPNADPAAFPGLAGVTGLAGETDVTGLAGLTGVAGGFSGAGAAWGPNTDAADATASGGWAESTLEFIPSAADGEQQRLDVELRPEFSDPLPVAGGYVAALLGGRFVVVDVRRARERILYEDYLRMLGHGSSVSQQLLFPERLVFSTDEYALLEENAVEFAALGFDLDFCGAGAVEVLGTPADLPADSIDRLLFELLQAFATPVSLADVRREKIAAVMARSGSRCTPRNLGREQAAALLAQLAATGNISFSPSGKAITAEITVEDLRAKLG